METIMHTSSMTWRGTLLGAALAMTVTVGLCGSARAGITIYTDRAAFLAALQPGSYTETFDALPYPGDFLGDSRDFSGSGFSFTASATDGLFSAGDSAADVWLSTNTATDTLTFTFTGGAPKAVGGNFFLSDVDGNSVNPDTVGLSVVAFDGVTTTPVSVSAANAASTTNFVGFISDTALTSLTVAVTGDNVFPFRWPTANNLTLGQPVPVPVPEPATLVSAGFAAVIGLAALRRRKMASR
jgi:hypothetical protein